MHPPRSKDPCDLQYCSLLQTATFTRSKNGLPLSSLRIPRCPAICSCLLLPVSQPAFCDILECPPCFLLIDIWLCRFHTYPWAATLPPARYSTNQQTGALSHHHHSQPPGYSTPTSLLERQVHSKVPAGDSRPKFGCHDRAYGARCGIQLTFDTKHTRKHPRHVIITISIA